MLFDYSKLRGRIVEKYGTQGNFAEALGVVPITVSRKLNSESGFTRDDIIIWSRLLEIRCSEIHNYFFKCKLEVPTRNEKG